MFYTFGQNNSGGSFDHDPNKGVGYAICVEADSAEEASARFWDIVFSYSQGGDCDCCGPRWDGYADKGSATPEEYGKPLTGGWGIPSYIHYLDGSVFPVPA